MNSGFMAMNSTLRLSGIDHLYAMHLLQKARLHAAALRQQGAILRHRRGIVLHMVTQVAAVKRRL